MGESEFRYPTFNGAGGLRINLEYILRRLDREYGRDVSWYEVPFVGISLREWMDVATAQGGRRRAANPALSSAGAA